ncbi:MAG TPA: nucleotidyltransferase domain-containing protein, partial [Acidimicrobiales bacterium]
AVERVAADLERDRHVVAAVLFGSLAYDVVSEWSDIDLGVVVADGVTLTAAARLGAMSYEGIPVHAQVMSRTQFRTQTDNATRGEFAHSIQGTSRLLFSRDASITELYDDASAVEGRDRQAALLRWGSWALYPLAKAHKWVELKPDTAGAVQWVLRAAEALAPIEVFLHGKVARREVMDQALELNPPFFDHVYASLVRGRPTPKALAQRVAAMDGYLTDRMLDLFGPIVDYLVEEADVRTMSEISEHLDRHWHAANAAAATEWLARKGVVEMTTVPMRMTRTSKAEVEEMAFVALRRT